jgi:hypothetical protein
MTLKRGFEAYTCIFSRAKSKGALHNPVKEICMTGNRNGGDETESSFISGTA